MINWSRCYDSHRASYFNSAMDTRGLGTHVASVAVGRKVAGANFLGLAKGTARGEAPTAKNAVCKICWRLCYSEDIFAAFEF